MRTRSLLKFGVFILSAVILTSCGGLKKMVKNYDQVTYTVTPTVLEMHGDSVEINISGKFPPKYFHKKVVAEATPILKFEGGEKAYTMTKLQGESVQDNNKDVEIGSYPFFKKGKIGVSIVLRSIDQSKIDKCNLQILEFIKEKKIEIVERE